MKKPLVSIIMSVYNAESLIDESLNSILNQTYSNLEIIVVDDCSTDSTTESLKKYKDDRLTIIYNDINKGLTINLNTALLLCKGKYIARMDADDISDLKRIESQVDFLEKHPNIDILGTQITELNGRKFLALLPLSNSDIKASLCFYNPIAHPTVMMRRSGNHFHLKYNEQVKKAQDYELWCRISSKSKFANLSKKLLRYRVHEGQISVKNKEEQIYFFEKTRIEYLISMGLSIDDIYNVFAIEKYANLDQKRISLYKNIFSKNCILDKRSLKRALKYQIFQLIIKSSNDKRIKIFLLLRNSFLNAAKFLVLEQFNRYWYKKNEL